MTSRSFRFHPIPSIASSQAHLSPETDRPATETAANMHPKTVMKNGKTAFHDGLTS
jgi:hypothetical protein